MRTIGIFGGSFDPIHFGHLAIARGLRDKLLLDEVRLIPTGEPPHRTELRASARQRLDWVEQAIQNERGLTVDDREVRRSGLCYTIDTLNEIQSEEPDALLIWLIGGDSFHHLNKWRQWLELLELGQLVLAVRPGFGLDSLPEEIASQYAARAVNASPDVLGKGRICVLPTPLLPFSSSEIRNNLLLGRDISYLTPVAASLQSGHYYQ